MEKMETPDSELPETFDRLKKYLKAAENEHKT